MTETLGDALPRQIKFMNEVAIPAYEEIIPIAPMTALTVKIMRAETQEAVEALASGDVARMARAYAAIKDVEL
jgi:hypothetical protein